MPTRITIITPSYQQVAYLEDCLRSVHAQGYPELEHIVVDGGSTDGSADVIAQRADRLKWWCSEKDRGQSHAINKGLVHGTGEVMGWINSDDELLPGALLAVGTAFEGDPELVMYTGRRVLVHPGGERRPAPLNADWPDALFIAPVVNQQATFIRTSCVRAVGGLDEALRYCMDLDLWWRLLFAHGTEGVRSADVQLATFRLHAGSKTTNDAPAFVMETAALLRQMVVATHQPDLVEVIDAGFDPRHDLRPSNARPEHAELVRYMVLRFMLKWCGEVNSERRFAMLKRLRGLFADARMLHEPDLAERWVRLRKGLSAPDYITYRIGRKLRLWSA